MSTNTFQDDAVARSRLQYFGDVSPVAHADALHDARPLVFRVLW
jgi:hypothetical protein